MRFRLLLGLISCEIIACSSNTFKPVDKADPVESALAAMDQHKSDEAIDILNRALQKNSEDWVLVSLMASAKAQKAGVDTTDIALEMAKQGGGSASGNALTSLFTILPPASSDGIDLLVESTELLSSIPTDELVPGDNFKKSIFNTALTALQAKFFDGNYQSAGGNGDATSSVTQIRSKIDAQEGTTQSEKLKNFLSTSSP
ncbi:MAG: hypothetical protein NTX25_16140 [Proteobacteria bacterium]|nr:hypothetical protein [Pseudomonadota bacterium]